MLRSVVRSNVKRVQHAILPQRCLASTFVQKIESAVEALPMREAVRYTEKNYKWTASQLNNYANAHANAMLEHGVKTGETVAVWLPEGPEKQVIFLASAKAGYKVVDLDLSLTSVEEVRESLKVAQAKVIYFPLQHGDTDYITLLRKAIPEFFHYDDSAGQLFHSKFYPTMRYFVHMGMDNQVGALNFKELFLLHPPRSYVPQAQAQLSDNTPLYLSISKQGDKLNVSQTLTHGQAFSSPAFSFAKNMAENQFFEV